MTKNIDFMIPESDSISELDGLRNLVNKYVPSNSVNKYWIGQLDGTNKTPNF